MRRAWTKEHLAIIAQILEKYGKAGERIDWLKVQTEMPDEFASISRGRSIRAIMSAVSNYKRRQLGQNQQAAPTVTGQVKPTIHIVGIHFCPQCGYNLNYINRALSLQAKLS